MMKTERDNVKKKVWEKPKISILTIKKTQGGGLDSPPEQMTYNPFAS